MNGETRWVAVTWDAEVPLNTSITVRARAGNTPTPDNTWGDWTPSFSMSPADLISVAVPFAASRFKSAMTTFAPSRA